MRCLIGTPAGTAEWTIHGSGWRYWKAWKCMGGCTAGCTQAVRGTRVWSSLTHGGGRLDGHVVTDWWEREGVVSEDTELGRVQGDVGRGNSRCGQLRDRENLLRRGSRGNCGWGRHSSTDSCGAGMNVGGRGSLLTGLGGKPPLWRTLRRALHGTLRRGLRQIPRNYGKKPGKTWEKTPVRDREIL